MEDIIFNLEEYLTKTQAQISMSGFLISLVLTAISAYILQKVYTRFGLSLSNRSSFGYVFVPIAMTTMVIITIVKSSLALSLGLVGALSIVRFRAAIKEPEELVYLFICIALGLGYGANQINITIIGFLMIIFAIALIRRSALKLDKSNVLYLTINKKTNSKSKFDIQKILQVLEKHSIEIDLKRLDESLLSKEISFMTTIENKEKLLKLREELFTIDKELEITFLDNTKVY